MIYCFFGGLGPWNVVCASKVVAQLINVNAVKHNLFIGAPAFKETPLLLPLAAAAAVVV